MILGAGLLLGAAVGEASPASAAGTLIVLLAAAAAVYRPASGLAVLAFSLPFNLSVHLWWVTLSTSSLIIALLMVVWIGRQVIGRVQHWQLTPLHLPVALFAAVTAVSLLATSGHTQTQVVLVTQAGAGFALFWLVTQGVRAATDAYLVVAAVILGELLQTAGIVWSVLAGNQVISEQARATATLADPNHFAASLVLVAPLLLALGLSRHEWWTSVPAVAAALGLAVALLATLSRGGWLGLLAGGLLLALLLPRGRWPMLALAASLMILLLAAGLLAPVSGRLAPHATGPLEMLASRWRVWTAAIVMAIQHPAVGVGLGNFQTFYPMYSTRPLQAQHAHNLFLNVAAERGVLGLLTLGIVLISLFKLLLETLRHHGSGLRRGMAAGLLAGFGAYLVDSLFDVSYVDYTVLLQFWLLVGVAAAVWRLFASRPPFSVPSAVAAAAIGVGERS